ncbi:MAG: PQQ-dependent sugar dehydrogenase [Steroidobacteraceae bacterium]
MNDPSIRRRSGAAQALLLLLWHAAAIVCLALLIPQLKLHVPFWALKPSELNGMEIVLGGYGVCALVSVGCALLGFEIGAGRLIKGVLGFFSLVFLYLLFIHSDVARFSIIAVFFAALTLIPIATMLGRLLPPALIVLVAVAAGAAAWSMKKSESGTGAVNPQLRTTFIHTAFYNLKTEFYEHYVPEPAVRGGGLSRIDDQYLLATGDGFMYVLNWDSSNALHVKTLPFRVPLNGDEFAKDTTGGAWRKPNESDALSLAGEDAGTQVIAWWFRVAGLYVQQMGEQVRIFTSHYYWMHDQRCWVERVSMLQGSKTSFLAGDRSLQWETLFETQPCLPIEGKGRRSGTPFTGHFGGGRMAMRDPDTLVLGVGDFGFNGLASPHMISQDMSASYGKSILIHIKERRSEIFTSGNRNPQGMYIDPQGNIWETEHGPQGGDELNLLKQGLNYGWPLVTYGTDYGTFAWPLNPKQGDHLGFEAPFFAWVPSIAVSDLIGVEKDLFPVWKGDLLVSSLNFKRLYRVRIRNDRVAYEEPIEIGMRIRDITEGSDGRIVLWADDDDAIISIRPLTGSGGEIAFATSCSGCHKVENGTSHRIGPDLWGIVGRKPGSAPGFADYSGAMRAKGGVWTEAKLDQFIKNPQAAVPGTAMEFAGVADAATRAQIIDYLKHSK